MRLLMLIALLQQVAPPMPRRYWVVDAFAGEMAISKAFRARGYPSFPLDICRNPNDESLSAFATRHTCKFRDTNCRPGHFVVVRLSSTPASCVKPPGGRTPHHGPRLQLLGADKLLFASSHGARLAFRYIRGVQSSLC